MSPRFRRYLLWSLHVLIAWVLPMLALNGLGNATKSATNMPRLHVKPVSPVVIWLTVFLLRWASRAEPGRRD